MKRIISFILLFILILSISGCNNNTSNNNNNQPNDNDNNEIITSNYFGDKYSISNEDFYKDFSSDEKELYYRLWDEDVKISLYVDISGYELSKIDEAYDDYRNGNSYKADTYRKCNLKIVVNSKEFYFEEVGIRMRGNTSRKEFCDESGNIFDFVHFRFSLTETFDGEEYQAGSWAEELYHEWTDTNARKERKNRTFATMEKFYYKWNKNYDNTYIREVYANRMFLAFGILAPHITVANLNLSQNGKMENMGVGGLYETIDKEFIKRNFDTTTKGGDLYKCTYRADFTSASNYGVETPTQRFAYSLKTNNDRSAPDYKHNKDFKNFISVLQKSSYDDDFKSSIENVIDMDYFARFEAVNYLLGNPDCIRNNANNFYLYFTPEGKGFLIPYDYDRCLGINQDYNPSGNGMMYEDPFSIYTPNGKLTNPLYLKTILNNGMPEYKTLFIDKIKEVLDSKWFTYDHFKKIYLSYKNNYSMFAKPSEYICNKIDGRINYNRFYFSEDGASQNEYSSTNHNISTSDYMRIKRETIEKIL